MSALVEVPHPGQRIKAEVIPADMSVTRAAQIMGVGRPALSNLLNGRAALSADMAARLVKAFRYPLNDLMDMQARYEAAQAKARNTPEAATAYVPPFLSFRANDFEAWVSHNIQARARLAVLLRTLIHSTGRGLSKVDFPGNDDSERHGWDGLVEASEGSPWIASGLSCWEFGTTDDPKAKAEGDFAKCTNALKSKERAAATFVFVTPRRWSGKTAWIKAKTTSRLWKDVRAFDASDLEQWLEQSLPAQAWFANETCVPAHGVRSLDRCWDDWASVSTPPLSGALFSSAIDASKRLVAARLLKPPEGPIQIAADSTEEALAFLSQLLGKRGGEELAAYRDRVLVFDKPGILPRLANSAQTFVPIVFTRDVERELAPHVTSIHSFVVSPRNSANLQADIVLDPANYEAFTGALQEMGVGKDEQGHLAAASGRSLTVLRRQLSTVPGVRTPEWAADRATADSLVPFLLVGAWDSRNDSDKIGLSLLAPGRSYEDLEKDCQSLAQLNDAPIWSVGAYRGLISKIDVLHAIANAVTSAELTRYFSLARRVLGEDDPALDLDDDKRWAASLYGKTREFSNAFREGICETLVLLAVHGQQLFKGRLGFDTETEVMRVIRDLLPTPLTTRVLEANDRDLPTYAEAAPDEFLSILERDLKSAKPAVLGLLRPVDSSSFGHSPSRTGLLWALEGLSWNPVTLPRAALILARLAQVEINDNWVNKPKNSLYSIFRDWMPQTAASHQQRIELLTRIARKFPDVAWKICVGQFGARHDVGHHSHKPRWRADGYGFGEPSAKWDPILKFRGEMIQMALAWPNHTRQMLCDLVDRVRDLSDADQVRVWALIGAWANAGASDAEKALIRERIRTSILTRRAMARAKGSAGGPDLTVAAKTAYAALEPVDPLSKFAWLFRDTWLEHSADEIEEIDKLDFAEREQRTTDLRIRALREIAVGDGVVGILKLAERGNASWVIGTLAVNVLSVEQLEDLLRLSFSQIVEGKDEKHSRRNVIGGALRALNEDGARTAAIERLSDGLVDTEIADLLTLAPFGKSTWRIVDKLEGAAQAKYWGTVTPDWIRDSEAESSEAIERLINAGRPRAAFACVHFALDKLDAKPLLRLLSALAEGGVEEPGQYQLEQYYVEAAFKRLNSSPEVTLEQKAGLEFAFLEALARPWDRHGKYGIPNLERYVELHPDVFVQAVIWTYKRNDGESDPPEVLVPPDRVESLAARGYKLLDALRRLPGHDEFGELNLERLAKWVTAVRGSCAELGRTDIADTCIGKLFSHAPVGSDDIWPCEQVREVMEDIQSEPLMNGANTGVFNARGAHWRGDDGAQERDLEQKYRAWSQALQVSHPFVASKLLAALADTYKRQASDEDTRAGIRRRMR